MIFTTDMLEPMHSRVVRWVTAAVLIMFAHVGGATLAMMHWQEEAADDSTAGAVLVELVLAPAVAIDIPDVAVGR